MELEIFFGAAVNSRPSRWSEEKLANLVSV
jgi:hypothetical protein